jgi:hypothetical protein
MLKELISLEPAPGTDAHLAAHLQALCASVPMAKLQGVEPLPANGPVDLVARLQVGQADWKLFIERKSSGQPRHVREGAFQLIQAQTREPEASYGVVAAPFVSPQSRAILQESGLGWMDDAGNVRLSFGGIHIHIEKTDHDPFATRRTQQSLFSPKSARLLRLMLETPASWKVKALSEQAGVSLGQVSNVRKLLLDKEWAELDPAGGMRLTQADRLLAAWREAITPPTVALKGYTLASGKEMDATLKPMFAQARLVGARVLLASHSVARRLAPYARVAGEFFYADEPGLELIRQHLQLSTVDKGENITVYAPMDAGLFQEPGLMVSGLPATGLVQTCMDLWASGERGQEAAEHLWREKMAARLERSS